MLSGALDDMNEILGWYIRYREPVNTCLARRAREAFSFQEEMEAHFNTNGR